MSTTSQTYPSILAIKVTDATVEFEAQMSINYDACLFFNEVDLAIHSVTTQIDGDHQVLIGIASKSEIADWSMGGSHRMIIFKKSSADDIL
jgi:cystathionine beta-lyase/cystathionine gamma-synthase